MFAMQNRSCRTQSMQVNRLLTGLGWDVTVFLQTLKKTLAKIILTTSIMGIIFRLILVVSVMVLAVAAKYTGPTNQAGIDLIKDYEGLAVNFYNNSGIHSIGYGHSCQQLSCSIPIYGKYRVPLTPETAEALLRDDLGRRGKYEDCVNKAVQYTDLNENQFSALVSFVYSVGCETFRRSTLLTKVNGGDIPGAANEFKEWVYNGRRRNKRLSWRRAREMFLFCRVEEEARDLWLCD